MADDDNDDWPPPETDPETIENARSQLRSARRGQEKILRWSYAIIAVLVILIIVLVATR